MWFFLHIWLGKLMYPVVIFQYDDTGHSGHMVWGIGLDLLEAEATGFESHLRHRC
jgi:hypothetical protein